VPFKETLQFLAKLLMQGFHLGFVMARPRRRNNRISDHVGESLSKGNRQTPDAVKDNQTHPQEIGQGFQGGQLPPSKHFGSPKAVNGYDGSLMLQGHAQKSLAYNGVLLVRMACVAG
jgi:hypothetical protein